MVDRDQPVLFALKKSARCGSGGGTCNSSNRVESRIESTDAIITNCVPVKYQADNSSLIFIISSEKSLSFFTNL